MDTDQQKLGTGERKNEGKPDYSFIFSPHLWVVLKSPTGFQSKDLLEALGSFQMTGYKSHLERAYESCVQIMNSPIQLPRPLVPPLVPPARPYDTKYSPLDDVINVWEVGAEKYSKFNWMAGMPWSVCIGCIHRHLIMRFGKGEILDPESGVDHMAHVVCNIQMLMFYVDHYQEGNDLPCHYVNFKPETEAEYKEPNVDASSYGSGSIQGA